MRFWTLKVPVNSGSELKLFLLRSRTAPGLVVEGVRNLVTCVSQRANQYPAKHVSLPLLTSSKEVISRAWNSSRAMTKLSITEDTHLYLGTSVTRGSLMARYVGGQLAAHRISCCERSLLRSGQARRAEEMTSTLLAASQGNMHLAKW